MAYESTPERLAIRDRLLEALLAVSVEGLITHEQFAAAIGKATTSPDAIKHSAFRIATDDHGVVFENVRATGYRRIAAGDVHRVGTQTRHGIRGKVRRGTRKILAVLSTNSNSMSNSEKIRAHAEIGVLGIIGMAAGRGAANRAYEAAEAHDKEHQRPPAQEDIALAVMGALGRRAA